MIKSYKLFTEAKEKVYNIWDFERDLINSLQDIQVHRMMRIGEGNYEFIKEKSEKFIGPGVYDKVLNLIDRISKSLDELDVQHVKDRLIDIRDEYYPAQFKVYSGMMYGKNSTLSYNGKSSRNWYLLYILHEMLRPTLRFGHPARSIRNTDEEVLVNDPKYQCINFDPFKYEIFKKNIPVPELNAADTNYLNYIKGTPDTRTLDYKLNDFYDRYKPIVIINIKGDVNIKQVESDFDKILPSITANLDYSDIIWDHSRGTRRFDDNREMDEYSLKIVLKF